LNQNLNTKKKSYTWLPLQNAVQMSLEKSVQPRRWNHVAITSLWLRFRWKKHRTSVVVCKFVGEWRIGGYCGENDVADAWGWWDQIGMVVVTWRGGMAVVRRSCDGWILHLHLIATSSFLQSFLQRIKQNGERRWWWWAVARELNMGDGGGVSYERETNSGDELLRVCDQIVRVWAERPRIITRVKQIWWLWSVYAGCIRKWLMHNNFCLYSLVRMKQIKRIESSFP